MSLLDSLLGFLFLLTRFFDFLNKIDLLLGCSLRSKSSRTFKVMVNASQAVLQPQSKSTGKSGCYTDYNTQLEGNITSQIFATVTNLCNGIPE